MTRHVVLNDYVYSDDQPDPLESLKNCIAFSVDDWGTSRAMSWVYGIVLGWDDEEGEPGATGDAMTELAARHGWSSETVDRLRALRTAFVALSRSEVA